MINFQLTYPEAIYVLRHRLALTQAEAAKIANISQATFHRIETNTINVPSRTLEYTYTKLNAIYHDTTSLTPNQPIKPT